LLRAKNRTAIAYQLEVRKQWQKSQPIETAKAESDRRLLRKQLFSRSASYIATRPQGGSDAQNEQKSGKNPGSPFYDIGRTSSAKQLVGLISTKCRIYAATFWVLNKNDCHQQYTNKSNQHSQKRHGNKFLIKSILAANLALFSGNNKINRS
jgi:hypothetical protein